MQAPTTQSSQAWSPTEISQLAPLTMHALLQFSRKHPEGPTSASPSSTPSACCSTQSCIQLLSPVVQANAQITKSAHSPLDAHALQSVLQDVFMHSSQGALPVTKSQGVPPDPATPA